MVGIQEACAIELQGLTRRFGRRTVVDGLELRVPRGSVFGFLGPNGAGKSTVIRMILGLTSPSRGRVLIFGQEVARNRSRALERVGALVDGPALHGHLSARDNLRAFALLTGERERERIDALLERVGLLDRADDRVRTFSYGMRMRLALALALLRRPELVVLDEPTDGLDPNGVLAVRRLLGDLRDLGVTVFISSHLLSEIEAVCDRVAILVGGRIQACGTVAELTREQPLEEVFLRLTRASGTSDWIDDYRTPPAATPSRGGFLHALRSEFFKLLRSRSSFAALAILVLAGALGALHEAGERSLLDAPRSGFTSLGTSMGRCSILLAVFALVMGAASLAGESHDGTLRSALARPLHRGALLSGKIAALAFLLGLLHAGALGGAFAVAGLQDGFSTQLLVNELADPAMVQSFGRGALWSSTAVAIGSSYLAALAICALAVLVSALTRRGAEAIIWAGILMVVVYVASSLAEFSELRALIFQPYVEGPWRHLTQLGEKRIGADWFWGNNLVPDFTGDPGLDRRRATYLALAVPALQGAAFFTLAWAAFVRRDVRA